MTAPSDVTGTTISTPPIDPPAIDDDAIEPVVPEAIVEQLGDELIEAADRLTVPRATYRVQLSPEFGFAAASKLAGYLDDLGVSHLYASPYLAARPGSAHGYDVVDYGRLNPELGGERDYDALIAALDRHDLGQLCDFVPNHMGIGQGANVWWLSVLEHGRCSPYGSFFDIDWTPLAPDMRGRVLLPFLGDQYGVILERGELKLRFVLEDGTFQIAYWENTFPVNPSTYPMILGRALDAIAATLAEDNHDLQDYQSIITALERLPGTDQDDPDAIAERQRESLVAKRRLAEIAQRDAVVREAIERVVEEINGDPDDLATFDALDALLDAQVFRLAYWRVAAEEINYRRFFAINELAAIRQEEDAVFAAAHELMLALLAEGRADGLRIDHVDGLLDPAGYLAQLQRAYLLEIARRQYAELVDQALTDSDLPAPDEATAPGKRPGDPAVAHQAVTDALEAAGLPSWALVRPALDAWLDAQVAGHPQLARPFYLLVEKILEHGEHLPADWPVHGTTGYEFANAVTGVFVDEANRRRFDDLYATFIGERRVRFDDIVYACKRLILRNALASELAVLANSLDRIASENRRSRDFTPASLRDALREVIACFPVYRTYVTWDAGVGEAVVHDTDRRAVESAIAAARRRNASADPSIFAFLRDVLLVRVENATEEQRARHGRFAIKVQQLSGPVMAKGLEDTAFYRYFRLTALNEVGGDPSSFGTTVAAFHGQNAARLRESPDAMLSSSTHDTKRAEDVRARIVALSEIPREWRAALNRWARFNRRHKVKIDGEPAPDRNDENLIYQTILGTWPFDHELDGGDVWETYAGRIVDYVVKAAREAQVHTNWVNPTDYDGAIETFIRRILDPNPAEGNRFLEDARKLRELVSRAGIVNGLSQHLLKLTVPGVPDVYQGTELWDFSLVDPDNRRPVDYGLRRAYLREMRGLPGAPGEMAAYVDEILATPEDGRIKLYLTERTLGLRREHPELFARGTYLPLGGEGLRADNVIAFARRLPAPEGRHPAGPVEREAIVVVPRLVVGLTRGEATMPVGDSVWGSTTLAVPGADAGTRYRDALTGEELVTVETGQPDQSVLPLAQIFARCPVALLTRAEAGEG